MKSNLLIIIAILCSSCSYRQDDSSRLEDTTKWEEVECPECKGIGQVKASTATRVYLGIITLGPGAMVQTETCEFCEGTGGVIKKRILGKDKK